MRGAPLAKQRASEVLTTFLHPSLKVPAATAPFADEIPPYPTPPAHPPPNSSTRPKK